MDRSKKDTYRTNTPPRICESGKVHQYCVNFYIIAEAPTINDKCNDRRRQDDNNGKGKPAAYAE